MFSSISPARLFKYSDTCQVAGWSWWNTSWDSYWCVLLNNLTHCQITSNRTKTAMRNLKIFHSSAATLPFFHWISFSITVLQLASTMLLPKTLFMIMDFKLKLATFALISHYAGAMMHHILSIKDCQHHEGQCCTLRYIHCLIRQHTHKWCGNQPSHFLCMSHKGLHNSK
jgi:hypothetical protein